MIKYYLVFFSLLFSSSLYSRDSTEAHPIDLFVDSCMAKDYSTMGMISCINEAINMWDAEVSKYYKQLEEFLDKETFEKLSISQAEWMKFRDNEIVFIVSFYNEIYRKMGGGTIYSLLSAAEKMELIKIRALQLKSYAESTDPSGN